MLLIKDYWHQGYGQILNDCRGISAHNNNKALILCHADVDAMAAARILTYMLRADQVEYVLEACPTYGMLQQKALRHSQSSGALPFAAIVLINVGGTRNLSRLFGDKDNTNIPAVGDTTPSSSKALLDLNHTTLFVLDGRMPVHLGNVYAGEHVVVFCDDQAYANKKIDVPSDGDNLSGPEDEEEEEESESESDSSEDDDDVLIDSDDDSDDEGEEEMDFNNDGIEGVSKPKTESTAMEDDDDDDDKDVMMEDEDIDYDGEDEGDGRITPQKNKKKVKRRAGAAAPPDQQVEASPSNDTAATETLDDEDDEFGTTQDTNTTNNNINDTSVLQPLSPAERHRQRQDRLRVYYNGGCEYGMPAAHMMYEMATQLRFGTVADLLWLSMVGTTDAYLQARLSKPDYAFLARKLRQDCLKLFPPTDSVGRANNTVYAETLLVNSNNSAAGGGDATTQLTFSELGLIKPLKTDYKFFLLRHSTLLDAFQLSPYVSTNLQLWTKPGMQRLLELLARMGYPMEECKHPYQFLKPSLRRRLPAQLQEYAEEFGLDDLKFTSFARVTGFSSETTASDVCYAVSALLECPIVSAADAAMAARTGKDSRQHQQEDFDRACFQAAYDALGNTPSPGTSLTGRSASSRANAGNIDTGIQWAFKLQRLILGTAVGLVQRNAITKLRHFRYAYITCTSQSANGGGGRNQAANPQDTSGGGNSSNADQQYHVLAKPLALTRLAHYLMDMHRANGKWAGEKNALPLVLLAEQPATNTYLVVGYEMSETQGLLLKNKFGQHFALVAQTMSKSNNDEDGNDDTEQPQAKAVARLESFDSHVVEVASSHAQRFLEQLHYIMDSV